MEYRSSCSGKTPKQAFGIDISFELWLIFESTNHMTGFFRPLTNMFVNNSSFFSVLNYSFFIVELKSILTWAQWVESWQTISRKEWAFFERFLVEFFVDFFCLVDSTVQYICLNSKSPLLVFSLYVQWVEVQRAKKDVFSFVSMANRVVRRLWMVELESFL